MTLEQLQVAVEELEALVNTKSDYAQAETQARELLNVLPTGEGKGDVEIKARILLALSLSLEKRHLTQEALLIVEQSLALADQAANKPLQAKAWNILGNIYQNLSDYPRALDYFGKALVAYQALGNKSGAATVTSNIGIVHAQLTDYPHAMEYFGKALAAYEELGDKSGAARVNGNIGLVNYYLSDYPLALEYYGNALAVHEELGEKSSAARVNGNIGLVHNTLSDYPRALEFYGKALALNEKLDNNKGVAALLGSIGNVHSNLSDYPHALEYMGKALALSEELGNRRGVAEWLGSIGIVHKKLSDYPRALEYYYKALALNEEIGNKRGVSSNLGNIGAIYATVDCDGYDALRAEEYLLRAIDLCTEIGYKSALQNFHKTLAELYKHEERGMDALAHFEKYIEVKEEVNVEETKKQVEQRDREKQLAIWRTRAQEKESILNNILPEDITTRLIKGENPIADHFDCVSILFMDIVDFTVLSSKISAQQLVHLLNAIFKSADGVMREFGLEKIKTIGDAYMAVAGAPTPQDDHATRAANAALALMDATKNLVVEFPENLGDRRWIEAIPEIQVRIGLHCGPAAAGVVGENKFLYDLWGDAVNTASRMESHGEAGRIHVSEEFRNAVEEIHELQTSDSSFHLPYGLLNAAKLTSKAKE